jgi:nucleotide-binding universal stress UspA family protein
MYQHILVPLDGSALSEAALPHAEALAQRLDANLLLVRAPTSPAALAAETTPDMGVMPVELLDEVFDEETNEAKTYLNGVAERLKGGNLRVTWEVVEGEVGRAILDTAHRHQCDLICMATHGRTGIGRLVMGSIAERIVRESHLPVLLIRPPSVHPTK